MTVHITVGKKGSRTLGERFQNEVIEENSATFESVSDFLQVAKDRFHKNINSYLDDLEDRCKKLYVENHDREQQLKKELEQIKQSQQHIEEQLSFIVEKRQNINEYLTDRDEVIRQLGKDLQESKD